jgi:hypothetical protein
MRSIKLITFLNLALIATAVSAQGPLAVSLSAQAQHTAKTFSHPVSKSLDATAERLIGVTDYNNNGASYVPQDTTLIRYGGSRYRSVFGGYAFDFASVMNYDVPTLSYVNDQIDTETYDSHNNILTLLSSVWVSGSSSYQPQTYNIVTYDGNNNYLTLATQQWNGSALANTTNEINTYDANNNRTGLINQVWNTNTSAWRNTSNDIYTYTANLVATHIEQTWDTLGNAWVNEVKTTFTYDANNNNIQQLVQNWNAGTTSWDNDMNYLYTYTAANKEATYISQSWNTGTSAWDNNAQDTYTYDVNNNETGYIYQSWGGSSWNNVSKYLYTYSANNDMLTSTSQTWTSAAWLNSTMDTYTYDGSHNQLSDISANWQNGPSSWLNTNRVRQTWDSYNNILSKITDTWNTGGFWQATTSDRATYDYYELYTPSSIVHIAEAAGSLSVYPSPAGSLLSINIAWQQAQAATITIYDRTGRLQGQWGTPAGASYQSSICVSSMAPGTYYMVVKGENGSITKAFDVVH